MSHCPGAVKGKSAHNLGGLKAGTAAVLYLENLGEGVLVVVQRVQEGRVLLPPVKFACRVVMLVHTRAGAGGGESVHRAACVKEPSQETRSLHD